MGRRTATGNHCSRGLVLQLILLVVFLACGNVYATQNHGAVAGPVAAECASWVSVGDASEGGVTILHKNRDKSRGQEVVIYRNRSGKNAYIAVSHNPDNDDVGMGINEHGLAVTCNVVSGINVLGYIAPVGMNRYILENCDSVEEAYEYLDDNKNKAYNEAVFFVADSTKAAVIECCSGSSYMSIPPWEECLIDGQDGRPSYAGRANRFEQNNNLVFDLTTHNERRYERIMSYLEDHAGSIEPIDFFRLSRDHQYVSNAWFFSYLNYTETEGAICNQPANGSSSSSTISAATFVIDPNRPELSCMWVALGAPDSAMFVPIHVAIMQLDDPESYIPENWATSAAYDLSESIREQGWWKELFYGSTRDKFVGAEKRLLRKEKGARDNAEWLMFWGWNKSAYRSLAEFDAEMADVVFENMSRVDSYGIMPYFVPFVSP